MSKWVVYENGKKNLQLIHKNSINGLVHNCGELRLDTPKAMIVDWVLKQDPQPGDLIKLWDGTVIQVSLTEARA